MCCIVIGSRSIPREQIMKQLWEDIFLILPTVNLKIFCLLALYLFLLPHEAIQIPAALVHGQASSLTFMALPPYLLQSHLQVKLQPLDFPPVFKLLKSLSPQFISFSNSQLNSQFIVGSFTNSLSSAILPAFLPAYIGPSGGRRRLRSTGGRQALAEQRGRGRPREVRRGREGEGGRESGCPS